MPLQSGVTIGGHFFSSKEAAKKHYGQIRDGAPPSGDLSREQELFMMDCVYAHAKIQAWIDKHDGFIERVYVGEGAKAEYASRSVRVDMRSSLDSNVKATETVGPKPCLAGLFGVNGCSNAAAIRERYYKQKREERARDSVNDDVDAFRDERRRESDGRFECAMCERSFAKGRIVVDHVSPLFETILGEFLACHPECTLSLDDPLTPEWRAHHGGKWSAQLLCHDCHYAKTAGETSERARKKRTMG